jgi:hypothetical protein
MQIFFTNTKASSATLFNILPAKLNMQTIISWISATNDKAATVLSVWVESLKKTVSAAAASGQADVSCTATAGIVANDIVIIQDSVDPTLFERKVVSSVTANTKYVMTANLTNSYSAGATIRLMKSGGGASAAAWSFAVGIATVDKQNNTAVFVGDKDKAILVEQDSCTTVCATHIAGVYRSY